MKRWLIGAAVGVGLFLVALLAVPSRIYAYFLAEQIASSISSPEMVVRPERPSLAAARLSLTLESLTLYFPRTFLQVPIREVVFSLLPTSLLFGHPTLEWRGNFSGMGEVEGRSAISVLSNSSSTNIKVDSLDLSSHPALSLLGITSGTLTITDGKLATEAGLLTAASGKVDIKDFIKGRVTPAALIRPFLPTGSIVVDIPQFDRSALSAELKFTDSNLDIPSFSLTAQEGRVTGSASMDLPSGALSGAAEVTLSARGLRSLGPLLPLATKGKIGSGVKSFSVQAENVRDVSQLQFSRD